MNEDGVRATSIDASEEFASVLVAYEPTVGAGVFRLPAPLQPVEPVPTT